MRSLILIALLSFCSGCAITSTEKRAAITTVGAAAGGIAGNELSHGDKRIAIGGAIAGAGVTMLAQGKDPEVAQEGFDQGYVQGQSDAIKRHYEMRMREHREKEKSEDGTTAYYIVPGPDKTNDGRELEPHTVAVPIKE